jgi:hypothetical protein
LRSPCLNAALPSICSLSAAARRSRRFFARSSLQAVVTTRKKQTLCCTHVFLHGLELWGFRWGRGRQLLVAIVAVVEIVPLQAVEKDEGGRQAWGCSGASYLAVVLSSVSITNVLLGGLPVVKHEGEFGGGRHTAAHECIKCCAPSISSTGRALCRGRCARL